MHGAIAIGASMDDEKISVNVRPIENGFIVSRSWCEKTKRKDGDGYSHDYHNEEFFMKGLPEGMAKMFSKGSVKDFMGQSKDDVESENGFEAANKAFAKSQKKKPKAEEESDGEEY